MDYETSSCAECKLNIRYPHSSTSFPPTERNECLILGAGIPDGAPSVHSGCPLKDGGITFKLKVAKNKVERTPKTQREVQLKFVMDTIEQRFAHCDWFAKGGKGRINIYEVIRKIYKEYNKMGPLYILAVIEYLTWNDQDPNYFNMIGIIKAEDFHGAIDKIEALVKRYHKEMFESLGGAGEE